MGEEEVFFELCTFVCRNHIQWLWFLPWFAGFFSYTPCVLHRVGLWMQIYCLL